MTDLGTDKVDFSRYPTRDMEMGCFGHLSETAGYLAIVETPDSVWVFEFKYQKSAKAAIRQIREKGYADAYRGDRRPVTLVGINFRLAKRNIDEPAFAKLKG